MPSYTWLETKKTDFLSLRKKASVLKNLGVPYTDDQVANADILAQQEAKRIAGEISEQGGPKNLEDKEIVALIAYLQSLGQKIQESADAQKKE